MEIEMGIREAIDILRDYVKDFEYDGKFPYLTESIICIDNYIDKLEKENEELKNMIKVVNIAREDMPNETEFIVLTRKNFENNYSYIPKDKIRNVIEKSSYPDIAIQKLIELLEEE